MAQDTDTMDDTALFQVKMDSGFKQKLRVEAAKSGKDMSQYVRDVLRQRWNSPTSPNKCCDTSTETPEPSGGFEGDGNGNVTDTNGESKDSSSEGELTDSEDDSE